MRRVLEALRSRWLADVGKLQSESSELHATDANDAWLRFGAIGRGIEQLIDKQVAGLDRPAPQHHLKGFASLTPERRREIAKLGGDTASANGKAHRFTDEQRRRGGQTAGRSLSREHMQEIGRKGGQKSRRR